MTYKPKQVIEVECPCCPERYMAKEGIAATCPRCGVTVAQSGESSNRASAYRGRISKQHAIWLHHGTGAQEGQP